MVRRAIAAGAAVLVLILLVLAVRGCLNARKQRALEDYAGDVSALVQESNQEGRDLFQLLDDPGNLTPLQYEQEIGSNRSTADALLSRARSLDVPGDMESAQRALTLTLELRARALNLIANRISTALGDEGSQRATAVITNQMRSLLASDVVYGDIARPGMQAVLREEDIDANVRQSRFLPDTSWLQEDTVSSALGNVSGNGQAAGPGVHGLGLLSVSANGTALQEGVPATVSRDGQVQLEIQVQNQGTADESGVDVSVSLDGRTSERTIDTIAPQETQTVTMEVRAPRGEATLTVEVEEVAGEQVAENNTAEYTVTFE